MMKRIKMLCLVVSIMLIVSMVLSGCGTKSNTKDAAEKETKADTAKTEKEPEKDKDLAKSTDIELPPYEIVWYQIGNGMTPDVELIQDEVAKLCSDLNITLKLTYFSWGEYTDKMALIINAAEPFDICFAANWTGYYQNASKNAFIDLKPIFEEKFPKFSKVIAPGLLECPVINGKLFALPTNKEAFSHFGWNIDLEYAEELGIDYNSIKTLEDMGNALRQFKAAKPDLVPLFMTQNSGIISSDSWDQVGDGDSPGVVITDNKTFTVVNQYELPGTEEYFKLIHQWYKEGLINQDAATVNENAIFDARQCFARYSQLGPTPVWTGPHGKPIVNVTHGNKYSSTDTGLGAMIAFSSTSKDPDRAMAFFDRFATTPELYNLITYGVKDIHYQIIDDTTNPPTWDYLDGQDGSTVGYNSCGAWALGGDWFMSYLSKTDPKDRNEVILAGNAEAIVSPISGFTFDATNVVNEIAACNNIVVEYKAGLGTGMLDPDKYLSEFIQKLKDNGSEKIIAEKQRQIDAWRIANNK